MSKIKAYDNGGKTVDRYTVVIDDDVFGMSENANMPDGFNQWAGKKQDLDLSSVGKLIPVDKLPVGTRMGIGNRLD